MFLLCTEAYTTVQRSGWTIGKILTLDASLYRVEAGYKTVFAGYTLLTNIASHQWRLVRKATRTGDIIPAFKIIIVTTEHEIKPGQTNMTGLQRHTVRYSVVQYTERGLQCWNRPDASNKPTVGRWEGGGRTHFKQVGTGGNRGGRDTERARKGGEGAKTCQRGGRRGDSGGEGEERGRERGGGGGGGAGHQIPSHREIRVIPPESQ